MKARRYFLAGFVTVSGLSGTAWAQVPGVPAAPAAASATAIAGGPPGAVATATAAQPTTLWSFLGLSCEQIEKCHQKMCATPLGQFKNQMFLPLSALSGGLIAPCCNSLIPTPAELADQGAVGAAAKIKADEAGAKARRAAMRYLGTVDCHVWPEAEEALIGGLRADHNECVRYEAALALGNGCCCTKKTMEALRIASSCSDIDGNPKETSERVRAAAVTALQACVACFVDPNPPVIKKEREGLVPEGVPVTPPEGEAIPVPPKPGVKIERPTGKAYYAKINDVPRHLIVEEARKVVTKYNQVASAQAVLAGQNSLVQIVDRATNLNGEVAVTENGLPRAEVLSPRPSNLWDMLSRQVPPNGPAAAAQDVVVMNSEPPAAAAPQMALVPEPVIEPKPSASRSQYGPGAVLAAPELVKTLKPSEVTKSGPYGQQIVIKPKTPKAKAESPAKLPAEMAAVSERQSLKPAEPAPIVPPPTPINQPTTSAPITAATPLAQRALKVLVEANPTSVREQIAQTLMPADVASCPELAGILVEVARGGGADAEATRKAAIKALVRTECASREVIAALDKLTDDFNAGVRVEAAIGMARLKLKASKN